MYVVPQKGLIQPLTRSDRPSAKWGVGLCSIQERGMNMKKILALLTLTVILNGAAAYAAELENIDTVNITVDATPERADLNRAAVLFRDLGKDEDFIFTSE